MAEAREPEKAREAAPVMVAIPYDEERAEGLSGAAEAAVDRIEGRPLGSVALIMAEIMEPGRVKVEIADVFAAYAGECEVSGKIPIPANDFPWRDCGAVQTLGNPDRG